MMNIDVSLLDSERNSSQNEKTLRSFSSSSSSSSQSLFLSSDIWKNKDSIGRRKSKKKDVERWDA
jgi:hypothetical protein